MLKLVDYDYYQDKCLEIYTKPSIPDSLFVRLIEKASSYIHLFTYNRINEENDITNDIKDTACEIIELLFEQDNLKNKIMSNSNSDKEISSETVGRHSVTYANKTTIQANKLLSDSELKKSCYEICYRHLIYTGLMDRRIK